MTTLQEVSAPAARPMRYLVADTETCGLGPDKIACEVAIREICPVTLETLGEWQSLIDPQHPIQPGAAAVHGITQEMVEDAPTMQEWLDEILKGEFHGSDLTMICHNAPFDVPLLVGIGDITQSVCTLFWARQLIHDSPNHKLQGLREHFGFPENEAHRALADVATTIRILRELLTRSGRSLEQFAATKEQTVHTMPWGSHKGKLVITLPVGYLNWMWEREDLEPNLREAVKKALKIHGITPAKLKKA